MLVGVPKETHPGERRVALTPTALSQLRKAKVEVIVEAGAGLESGFADDAYATGGATIGSRAEVFAKADVIVQVRALGANPGGYAADLGAMREGQALIAMTESLAEPEPVTEAASKGVVAFSLEMLPRITRAQSMDVLSSQANLGGYKAVLLAADQTSKVLPMMMTAAGTITPAKVFVIGAGVAGLQAIATAKRLGAVVSAYDVRAAVKEQVESLGARFVEMELEGAEGAGGYAREMGEEFLRKQREMMTGVLAESDIVITTAAVPGKKAPVLVTEEMVAAMKPGAVIVDLAAEKGGNCPLTKAGETVVVNGVIIIGRLNLPSDLAHDASQLFAKNVSTFLASMVKDGAFAPDTDDELVSATMLTHGGNVVNARIRETLGLEPLPHENGAE